MFLSILSLVVILFMQIKKKLFIKRKTLIAIYLFIYKLITIEMIIMDVLERLDFYQHAVQKILVNLCPDSYA
jgi:hypothetical protein